MKGFSKSITNRFQPIWKVKNQTGKGNNVTKEHQIHEIKHQEHQNQYEIRRIALATARKYQQFIKNPKTC